MLVHPWDAVLDDAKWRQWLAGQESFGLLVVNNLDPAGAPLVQPTHFTVADLQVLEVTAKFKYDDEKPVEHRERVVGELRQRGRGLDHGAARQLERQLLAKGLFRAD